MKKAILGIATLLMATAILSAFERAGAATGGIKVTVTSNGAPRSEVLVGISLSEEDRENSKYVSEKESNSAGIVNFTAINAGKYYVDAFWSDDETELYAEAEVTVADGVVEVKMALVEEGD